MARAAVRWDADILVVGAGVLGVAISYWLSHLYDAKVVLVDREEGAAAHASSRNTGVIHRPFYLDPRSKRTFAASASLSYPLWRELARRYGLPWKPVGTLEVALDEAGTRTLEKHREWGIANGVDEEEIDVLDSRGTASLEREVRCSGALHSKSDVSVNFGAFTRTLLTLALDEGVRFVGGASVGSVKSANDGLLVSIGGRQGGEVKCKLLVNAAGGGALDIAHMAGLASSYSELNFRGEYWLVDEPLASRVGRNVYVLPRHPEFPFLDPHFVVRWDGARQIGPNAVVVSGPHVYSGVGLSSIHRLLSRPAGPKLKLLKDPEFLALAAEEWRSSVSKRAMCSRVQAFIPSLEPGLLNLHGVAGVRSPLVGPEGFLPEAVVLYGEGSVHVLNYNSPGATGAPAYSATLVRMLSERGVLEGFRRRPANAGGAGWDFSAAQVPPSRQASGTGPLL